MKYNPEIHRRRSIRLKEYDYSNAGAYYVTICTWNKEHYFGKIINSETIFSPMGEIIQQEWYNIPARFPNVELDTFIIMPNHMHGIIVINHVGAQLIAPNMSNALFRGNQGAINQGTINQDAINQGVINQGAINRAPTVGNIVRAFKA